MSDEKVWHADNIRELLGHLVGKRLMEITQEDEDHEGDRFIDLLFEDGNSLRFYMTDSEHYIGGFPFSFSDPNDEEDDGFYHPDPEHAAAKQWAVVEDITPLGTIYHTIPCFGQLHFIGESCWCHPVRVTCDNGRVLSNHNEVPDAG
jgi:hypothetical protein